MPSGLPPAARTREVIPESLHRIAHQYAKKRQGFLPLFICKCHIAVRKGLLKEEFRSRNISWERGVRLMIPCSQIKFLALLLDLNQPVYCFLSGAKQLQIQFFIIWFLIIRHGYFLLLPVLYQICIANAMHIFNEKYGTLGA